MWSFKKCEYMCIHDSYKYELKQFKKKFFKFFPADEKNTIGFFGRTLFHPLKLTFGRTMIFFSWKPVNTQKLYSIPFLSLLLISERSDHMKYLKFIFTNNTISCIIQYTLYRCEFRWIWCDPLILFIVFLRRCLDCFKI